MEIDNIQRNWKYYGQKSKEEEEEGEKSGSGELGQ